MQALERCKAGLAEIQSMWVNIGYVWVNTFPAQGVQTILVEYVTVQITRRSELVKP